MIRPLLLVAAVYTAPASALEVKDLEMLEDCAQPNTACDMEALAETLGLLEAADVKVFGDLGMESFAMLTALRHSAEALFLKEEGEGCFAEEERTAALEIWSRWVRLPDDAPEDAAQLYRVYDTVLSRIVSLELDC